MWKRWLVIGIAVVLGLNVALCSIGVFVSEPEDSVPSVTVEPTRRPVPTAVRVKVEPTVDANREARLEAMRSEARDLWNELQKMRTDPEFIRCGYAPRGCGPGADWNRRLQDLNDRTGMAFLGMYGFSPMDMWNIGVDYFSGQPGNEILVSRVKKGLGLSP